MRRIDLFSDTTTRPTEGMRRAMAAAEVGDEQRGTDPTVLRLQERVAGLLGKEAALFLPSTTMANQIAIKLHTDPGDEVILEAQSHPVNAEAGGAGLISGVLFRTIPGRRGLFTFEAVKEAIRPSGDPHFSRSRLLCVENTHNMGGGTVWPLELLREVTQGARSLGLALHLDGARLMNASVASGAAPEEIAAPFDTVSFCLSKGLGCPVGGLIAGSRELIAEARRYKQALGGAMRQSGILAAAGLYALDHHVERLADDHRRARRFAEGLAEIPGIEVDPKSVETNMVFFSHRSVPPAALQSALAERGLLLSLGHGGRLRAVTHLDVDDDAIEEALATIGRTLREEGWQ